jgi:hypothetical protein
MQASEFQHLNQWRPPEGQVVPLNQNNITNPHLIQLASLAVPPPKPQTVLQPIPAESTPVSDSTSIGARPVTFPQFTPIAIKQHAAEVRTGGLQDAF